MKDFCLDNGFYYPFCLIRQEFHSPKANYSNNTCLWIPNPLFALLRIENPRHESFPKSSKQSFEQQKKGRCLLYVSKPSSVIVYQLEICCLLICYFQITKGKSILFPIQSNRGYYSIKFINSS